MKQIELKELSKYVLGATNYCIIGRPLIAKDEQKTNAGIIIPDNFLHKANGEKHTIVTEAGKISLVEVLLRGEQVQQGIQPGCIVRIRPTVPEDIIDGLLSKVENEPLVIISASEVLAYYKLTGGAERTNMLKDAKQLIEKINSLQIEEENRLKEITPKSTEEEITNEIPEQQL